MLMELKKTGIPNAIKDSMVVWHDLKKQGATNENMANNPILKDLSGNGHDATCYNFAWSGISGIGGYYFDTLTKWYTATNNDGKLTVNNTKIHITRTTTNSGIYYYLNNNKRVKFNDFIDSYTDSSITIKPFKIKVSGLPEGYDIIIDGLYNENVEGSPNQKFGNVVIHNGEHIIDIGTANLENVVFSGQCHFPRIFTTANMPQIDCDITIEFLPEYPNALVSDGVDDYCRVDGLPILTDYTVIAKRKLLSNNDGSRDRVFISKRDAANSVNGALQTANAGVGVLAAYAIAAGKAAISPTDTINQAIGKLEKALNDLAGDGDGSVADQIQEAIATLVGDASEGYQTLKELEDAIKQGATNLTDLETRVEANEDKLATVQGEETVDGSIKKALKDAKDYTDSKLTWTILD